MTSGAMLERNITGENVVCIGDFSGPLNHTSGGRLDSSLTSPSTIIMTTIGCVAIVANLSTLFAILQVRRKLNTYLKLISSLSISDIMVGCCVLMGTVEMSPLGTRSELCLFINWRALRMTTHVISLLNLLGLALDHFWAIVRPLKYVYQTSSTRTTAMIISFWVASFVCGFSDFFVPSPRFAHCGGVNKSEICLNESDFKYLMQMYNLSLDEFISTRMTEEETIGAGHAEEGSSTQCPEAHPSVDAPAFGRAAHVATNGRLANGFCENVICSKYDSEYLVFLLAIFLMISMVYLYARVCHVIYSVGDLRGQKQRTLMKNKRGLITTLLILGTFMVCWLPYCIFNTIALLQMLTDVSKVVDMYAVAVKVDMYLYDLLLLNSICDPLIYAWRIRDVRIGYKRMCVKCITLKLGKQSRNSLDRHTQVSRVQPVSCQAECRKVSDWPANDT